MKGSCSGFTVTKKHIPDISYTNGAASVLHKKINIVTPETVPQKRKIKEQIVASIPTLFPRLSLSCPPGVYRACTQKNVAKQKKLEVHVQAQSSDI